MLNLKKLMTKVLNTFGTDVTHVTNSYGTLRLTKDKATNTVRGYGYFRSSTDLTINTVLFNVPSGYRPKETYSIPMFLSTNSNVATSYFGFVNTEGNITQQLGGTIRSGFFSCEWAI